VIPKGSVSPFWLFVAIGALFLLWFFLHVRSGEHKGRDVLLPLRPALVRARGHLEMDPRVIIPELLRLLRARHRHPVTRARPAAPAALADLATPPSTAPAKPANAGTPTPTQHHDHNEPALELLQGHQGAAAARRRRRLVR
jgi:hypothetical protein